MIPSPFASSGLTVIEAMDSPEIFGPLFQPAEDWRVWRVALKALFGLAMDEGERAIFTACTGRDEPPTEPSLEAFWIVGRRGGKSRVAALVGVYLTFFREWGEVLVEGEPGVCLITAQDIPSAETILNYIRALIAAVPELQALVLSDVDGEIMLANGLIITVRAATFRAVRSRTYIAALCDEIAFWWVSKDSANPDSEVLNAIRPGLATTGGPLICLSSPYAEEGVLYDAFKAHYGKDGLVEGEGPEGEAVTAPRPLIWKAATLTMHPNSAPLKARVKAAYALDPATAASEYGAQFRSILSGFLERALIEASIAAGVTVRPWEPGWTYRAGFDPAGGAGQDSATLCVVREREGSVSEVCFLREWQPPFVSSEMVRDAAADLKAYHLSAVSGDAWGKGPIADMFRTNGITYVYTKQSTSELYRQLPALLTGGGAVLLDNERVVRQLASLRRKTGSQGHETIDHPTKGHDDLCAAMTVALLVRAYAPPETAEEEERLRPEGSFERKARETAAGYEPAILAQYGEAQGKILLANARLAASAEGDFDPEVYEANLEDLLPGLARIERGRRSAGHH